MPNIVTNLWFDTDALDAAEYYCSIFPNSEIMGMDIQFLNMGVTDILCELSIPEEEAKEMLRPIDEKGKGEWVLEMDCRDTEGTIIAKSVCHYYIKKMT